MTDATFDAVLAEALIGIDTLWGGDVMNPSGVGPLHRRLLVLG